MYKKIFCMVFLSFFLLSTNAKGLLEITENDKRHEIEKIQKELDSIPCIIKSEIKSYDEHDSDCLTYTIKITMTENRYLEIENYYGMNRYFNETYIRRINDIIPVEWICGVFGKKNDSYNYRYYVSALQIEEIETNAKLSINNTMQLIDNFDKVLCFVNSFTEFSEDIPFGDLGYFSIGDKPVLSEWDNFHSSYENEIQITKDNSWKFIKLFKSNLQTYNNWMILHNQKFRIINNM